MGETGDTAYLGNLKSQTMYRWIHVIQNRNVTDILINNTTYAWKDMFEDSDILFGKTTK
ncbi:hypothetical protein RCZ01_06400 [Capnocytophaga felis]|uniref:Uncharacterized protein n=1 Tax=Capnocytophaga felis TaxID=2267611 RepID=A0A5M4B743_9FLAO|nr:hypothetical protein RCZ01_06400 [Capnocytophaga felis]GET47499.1 hypothetical protein RCZ02_03300 [Capnocytophaga felis]